MSQTENGLASAVTVSQSSNGSILPTPPSTIAASTAFDSAYYNSEEYRQYYQQYTQQQQQQTQATSSSLTTPLLSTANATPLFPTAVTPVGTNYTPEQVKAYYETLAATNPEAYAAIYAQYYGTTSQTTAQTYEPSTKSTANNNGNNDDDGDDYDDDPTILRQNGQNAQGGSALPVHCNEKMNLNPLIFANINQSPYFKTTLHQIKTYQEIIDEIYYSVNHLEPWERGSRNASGVTGMCGSVRGVSAGGIISTPFCILYKLYILRLTKKQVQAMIKYKDCVFIRGLGFLYLRFTQQPKDLYRWFEPHFGDDEVIDPRAGGGSSTTIGKMCRKMLTRNEWFSTMLPRIPVPIQKEIDSKLKKWEKDNGADDYDNGDYSSSGKNNKNSDDRRRNHDDGDDDREYGHHSRRPKQPHDYYSKSRKRSRSRSPYESSSRTGNRNNNRERDSDDRDYRGSRDKYRSRDRF